MKTISTIAMTLALALSLAACATTTSSPVAVKSSVNVSEPVVVLRHPFHQLASDGASKPIPVSTDYDSPTLEEDALDTPLSMKHTVVSILGQIVVACANSGNCW